MYMEREARRAEGDQGAAEDEEKNIVRGGTRNSWCGLLVFS